MTLGGIFERAAQHNNKQPYKLPERWLKKKSLLNLNLPLNFVSTNDIIGGNSGSPVINKQAEIVRIIFDTNAQALVGNFVYDEAQNRAISVDARGIGEALGEIYGAKEIVNELTK